MSDALSRLVQRVVAPETVLQARVPLLFESGVGEAEPEVAPAPAVARHTEVERVQTHERESERSESTREVQTHEHTRETSEVRTHEHTRETREATSETNTHERLESIATYESTFSEQTHVIREKEVPRFAELLAPTPAPRLPLHTTIVRSEATVAKAEQQHVEITIGRIDVRAVTAPQTPSRSRERAPRRDVLTLEQYIRERSGR